MIEIATTPTVDFFEESNNPETTGLVGTAANRSAYFTYPEPTKTGNPYLDYIKLPRIAIDTSFGGHDDPFVVSDDNTDREERENWHSRQNAIHLFFSKSLSHSVLTEGVIVERDRQHEIANYYGLKFSRLMNAAKVGALVGNYIPALASMVLLEVSRTSALFDRASYNAIQTASLKHTMMNKYSALLGPLFAEAGFSASEPYEDGLGALVVDYIKLEDRVTFALDESEVELLYIDAGEFRSVHYENPSASLLEVVEFARNQFA